MFDFLRRSHVRRPTPAICHALEQIGVRAGADSSTDLGVVERSGTYAGRSVTFITVFDRDTAQARGVKVGGPADLDANPELAVAAGYVEEDGTVLIRPSRTVAAATETGPRRVQVEVHDVDRRVLARGDG